MPMNTAVAKNKNELENREENMAVKPHGLIIPVLIFAGYGGPAFAQIAADGAQNESADVFADESSMQASSRQPAARSGAEDQILVTAQRRSERLEDVPISMAVLDDSRIASAGIKSTTDLDLLVPGLTIQTTGAYVQPALRGVSTQVTGPGADNPIAVYVDGVYEGSQNSFAMGLPDVERIEVLRGPQGTLFGRNATAGAIQIFTKNPSFTSQGDFSAEAGMFDGAGSSRSAHDLGFSGFVTGPLYSDVLAASVSVGYRTVNGFSRNIAYGAVSEDLDRVFKTDRLDYLDTLVIRGKLLFEPADNLSILATAYFNRQETDSGMTGLPVQGLTNAAVYPDAIFGAKPWQYAYDTPRPYALIKSYGASIRAELETDVGTFTSTSALTRSRYIENVEIDGAYAPDCLTDFNCTSFIDEQPNDNFSQELLYSSTGLGALSLVAGANLYHSTGSEPAWLNDFALGAQPAAPQVMYPALFIANTEVKTRAYGAFAEANFAITDSLTLTAGGRYSYEKKIGSVSFFGSPLTEFDSPSWDSFTPRVAIRYALGPNTNLYATFSKGFKSGVLPLWSDTAPSVRPEKLTAYEAGLKTASRDFRFNIAGFYYDYTDLQVQTFTGATVVTSNAAKATIYGLDADAELDAGESLRFRAGVSWLPKAEYDEYSSATAFGPPVLPNGSLTSYAPLDLSGERLYRAPEVTATFDLTYTANVGSGRLLFTPTIYYSSEYFNDGRRLLTQGDYVRANAEIAYEPSNGGYRLALWARNITNSEIIASTVQSANVLRVSYDAPREFGVTLDYSF